MSTMWDGSYPPSVIFPTPPADTPDPPPPVEPQPEGETDA